MKQQAIDHYLSSHAFFPGLDPAYIKFLASSATELRLDKGKILFHLGEPADKFYLLRSGKISVQVPAVMGPALEIQDLGKDQVLGWSWLIPPYRWNFQAKVMADSDLFQFDGGAILTRCEADPRFGYELCKRFAGLMSERLDAARQKMMDQWNPPGFA